MIRRYLNLQDAESALKRGKAVECFLGRCERDDNPGIQWLRIRSSKCELEVSIYETADLGDESFLDIYEFGPLDPELGLGDANEVKSFTSFGHAIEFIERRFAGSSERLLNEFMIQDEYADYISSGRK